jgi:hypothetical protein
MYNIYGQYKTQITGSTTEPTTRMSCWAILDANNNVMEITPNMNGQNMLQGKSGTVFNYWKPCKQSSFQLITFKWHKRNKSQIQSINNQFPQNCTFNIVLENNSYSFIWIGSIGRDRLTLSTNTRTTLIHHLSQLQVTRYYSLLLASRTHTRTRSQWHPLDLT